MALVRQADLKAGLATGFGEGQEEGRLHLLRREDNERRDSVEQPFEEAQAGERGPHDHLQDARVGPTGPGPASIDQQALAGDVRGIRRQEKRGRLRHLVRGARPARRDRGPGLGRHGVGVDPTRQQVVHAEAAGTVPLAVQLGQGAEPRPSTVDRASAREIGCSWPGPADADRGRDGELETGLHGGEARRCSRSRRVPSARETPG